MTNEETKFVGMIKIESLKSYCLNVLKTRPYNVNNDASVDFNLEDAKKCEKYSKPLCFSQGRHLSKEKKSKSLSLLNLLIHYDNLTKLGTKHYQFKGSQVY